MKKELVNGRPKSCTDQTQEHDDANVQDVMTTVPGSNNETHEWEMSW